MPTPRTAGMRIVPLVPPGSMPGTAADVLYALGEACTGAAAWTGVSRAMDPAVELRSFRLPGRESRLAEAPLDHVDAIVDDLVDGLLPSLADDPRPYGLVGACSGALGCYELARRLGQLDVAQPRVLIAISQQAPWIPPPADATQSSELPIDQLLGVLERFGSPQVHPGLGRILSLLEPAMRADLRAFERYRHRDGEPLRCRVVCLYGDGDPWLHEPGIQEWARTTTGTFRAEVLPGAHQLASSGPAQLAQALQRAVRP